MPEGEERRGELEAEMALLGRLVRLTSEYLSQVAGAYIFLAYGISFPACLMLFEGLWESYGLLGPAVAAEAGSLAGMAVGLTLSTIIVRRVFEALPRRRGPARLFLLFTALFVAVMLAGMYGLALLDPSLLSVSWYYGLALALAILAPVMGGWSFLVASATITSLLPLVLSTMNVHIALAGLMLGYLAGGSYSIWRASKLLARE
jgi:heme exporter protein D